MCKDERTKSQNMSVGMVGYRGSPMFYHNLLFLWGTKPQRIWSYGGFSDTSRQFPAQQGVSKNHTWTSQVRISTRKTKTVPLVSDLNATFYLHLAMYSKI